jgi:hypothetical protein
MPVRVKCRCGQELTLRYGEWVYFLIGLVLLCLVSNSVALLLLYFRLEELSGAPLRSSAAGAASAESILSPPEAKAQSAKAEPDANPPSGAIPETDLPAKPASAPERKSSRAERPLMPRPPDARETGAAPEASPPASGAGVPPPAAEPARLLASAVDEEPWASAPWREGSLPPEGGGEAQGGWARTGLLAAPGAARQALHARSPPGRPDRILRVSPRPRPQDPDACRRGGPLRACRARGKRSPRADEGAGARCPSGAR